MYFQKRKKTNEDLLYRKFQISSSLWKVDHSRIHYLDKCAFGIDPFQSHDVHAEFHDVGRWPAEPAHDEQHVIVVDGRWDGPDGHDRGHDGGP